MEYTIYNPNYNNYSSSSSTPILIPPPYSSTRSITTKNGKNKSISNKKNKKDGVRLSTDPQSVAARERRHRISDRFKVLQSLVPGGAKLDIVSMLEQAIQYVKFLKAQIWLHEAIMKNNVTNINNTNDQGLQYDHNMINNNSSCSSANNDVYFYDQYYHAYMYNCHNNNVSHQSGGGDGEGGFGDLQGINMAVAPNQATQVQDFW